MNFMFTIIFGVIGILLPLFGADPAILLQGLIFGILVDLYVKADKIHQELSKSKNKNGQE
ncbi:hypothetical protein [Bacillus suaedaesalsae]|uniref:Holin n=1 Tax=Bacillus suaedaesalsae TaxID=2810349 RepID=A0ABS2DMD0_9BACI|nr:hypothetical protein [Bacillus suaedaesalsae]MBM6619657.1 hypothetical protein [Bacillus suaedaesalsae]